MSTPSNLPRQSDEPTPTGARLRILFLSPFPPSLDGAHGGSRVIAQLLDRLARRHSVALMCPRHPDDPPVDDGLRRRLDLVVEVNRADATRSLRARATRSVRARLLLLWGKPLWAAELGGREFRRRLVEVLREWKPDVVQLEYSVMGVYLDELAASGAPVILAEPDPPTNAAIDLGRASTADRLLRELDVRAWRRFERDVLSRVDAAVVFTSRDAAALSSLQTKTEVVQIPFGTDFLDRGLNPSSGEDCVLFVGNFVHPPNVDAADRLVRSIFPRVRERQAGASLYIVGENPPAQLREASGDGVMVTGRVPDLIPYVARACVVAAPIRFGGGMRVKVLEALAAGTAVVASRLAVEGLDVSDGNEVFLAETDIEFADRIASLLANPELRYGLATRAWSWARANLTWAPAIEAHERLYRDVLRRAGGLTAPSP